VDAVVAGHVCLDLIPDLGATGGDQFLKSFAPGRLLEVGPMTVSTGGPVSNTGLALVKLGVETRLMGKVGDDLFGRAVREIVAGHGGRAAEGMVVDREVRTSYTIVISPPGLDRFFLHYTGANDTFGAGDVRYDVVAQARLFHFGYPPIMRLMYQENGRHLVELFRRAKETGATTSLDMSLPDPTSESGRADWAAILRATLPFVDVFMPSAEEILTMLRRPKYGELRREAGGSDILPLVTAELLSEVSQELLGLGAKVVGIKLGHRGLYLRTAGPAAMRGLGRARPADAGAWADRVLWAPCFKAALVGTLGAGDAAIAGFLSALLRGLSAEEAATAAVAVGACNVEAADALSGIRSWEATLARAAAGWERHPMTLDAPGWRRDAGRQLWAGPGSR
jgi:sugar/nucleoside kinase (ribokinase family)